MDDDRLNKNGETKDRTAIEVFSFTAGRLPRYVWLARVIPNVGTGNVAVDGNEGTWRQ